MVELVYVEFVEGDIVNVGASWTMHVSGAR